MKPTTDDLDESLASAAMVAAGIVYLPLDLWAKGYLVMGVLALAQSASRQSESFVQRRIVKTSRLHPVLAVPFEIVAMPIRPSLCLDVTRRNRRHREQGQVFDLEWWSQ